MDAPTQLQEHVAGEIRALLARRRITGRAVARRLGWTPQYVSRRLTGQLPFDVTDLEAIASMLDVRVSDLINEEGMIKITFLNTARSAA